MVKIIYKAGDKVFAKVKGYPPWPAKIVSEAGRKYNVLFYGTKETGTIKPEDLSYYSKYKNSYVKKYLKRLGYEDAVKQIEEAIENEGGDGNPVPDEDESVQELDMSDTSSASSVADKKVSKRKPVIEGVRKSTGRGRKFSSSASESRETSLEPIAKKLRRESNTSTTSRDESEKKVKKAVEGIDEGSGNIEKFKNSPKNELENQETNQVETEPEQDPVEEITKDEETTKEPELTEIAENLQKSPKSCSIENVNIVKKFNVTADMIVTEQLLNNHILYADYVKKNSELFIDKPVETRRASKDDVLPVKLPSGKLCCVKIHQVLQWPLSHKDEYQRALYDEKVAKAALETKKLLISGTQTPVQVNLEVIMDIGKTPEDVKEILYTQDIESKRWRLNRLKKEAELVTWDTQIKNSLGLDIAMPDEAIKNIKDFWKFDKHLDLLMFKKHPHVLDTIRRLRKYVGNVSEWVMSAEDSDIFAKKTETIRTEAERIYNRVKTVLDMNEKSGTFWDNFMELVAEFRKKCRDMEEKDVLVLCAEPDSRQAFLDRIDQTAESESTTV
ncbi:PC4 and SFRS1-interacting protein [Euwallacea similis]|uniref:PC4 and SFRS1-interacting protein n=1 Tax=Euwallacea similis TaxID=1736056 RepID=UPI00344D1033